MDNQYENKGCIGRRAAAVGLGAMPEAGPAPFTAEQFWTVMLTMFNELFTTEITRERVEQASQPCPMRYEPERWPVFPSRNDPEAVI